MILWVFIKIFGVKRVITNIYRYLPIFYRYFTDIYRYFTDIFSEIPAQVPVLHSRDFSMEKSAFFYFSTKNRRFYRFFPDFSSHRFFLCFSSRCRLKTYFSTIYRPKKMIFCSLRITHLISYFHIHCADPILIYHFNLT